MPIAWTEFLGLTLDGLYPIRDFIAESGGQAEYSTELDGLPAVIRLMPDSAPNAESTYRGWESAVNLNHPNLLRVHAAGRTQLDSRNVVYAVTDPVEDRLGDVLAGRSLDSQEATPVVEALLAALTYLHSKGMVYGGLTPDRIVAANNKIKLLPGTILTASSAGISRDVADLGATTARILGVDPADASRLPEPFNAIVTQTMQPVRSQWKLNEVRRALNGEKPEVRRASPVTTSRPAGKQPRRFELNWIAIGGIAAALLLAIFGMRALRKPVSVAPVPSANTVSRPAVRTLPPETSERARTAPPVAPSPIPQRKSELRNGDWAVVAAIYRDYDAATKRASALKRQAPHMNLSVFPEKGQGRKYMVVVGTGMTKNEAEKLRSRARSAGLPHDLYVTRLRG